MVVLVTTDKDIPHKEELINILTQEIPSVKSIIQNINNKTLLLSILIFLTSSRV